MGRLVCLWTPCQHKTESLLEKVGAFEYEVRLTSIYGTIDLSNQERTERIHARELSGRDLGTVVVDLTTLTKAGRNGPEQRLGIQLVLNTLVNSPTCRIFMMLADSTLEKAMMTCVSLAPQFELVAVHSEMAKVSLQIADVAQDIVAEGS